jgi:hypothetical protein
MRRKVSKFILTRLKRAMERRHGIDERGNIILLFGDKRDIFHDTVSRPHNYRNKYTMRTKRMPFTAVKHSTYNGNPKLPRFHLFRTNHHFRGKECWSSCFFVFPDDGHSRRNDRCRGTVAGIGDFFRVGPTVRVPSRLKRFPFRVNHGGPPPAFSSNRRNHQPFSTTRQATITISSSSFLAQFSRSRLIETSDLPK